MRPSASTCKLGEQRTTTQGLACCLGGAHELLRKAGAGGVRRARQRPGFLLVEGDSSTARDHQRAGHRDANPPSAGFFATAHALRQDKQARPWVVCALLPNLQVLAEGRMRSRGCWQRRLRAARSPSYVTASRRVIHAPSLDKAADLRAIGAWCKPWWSPTRISRPRIQFGDNALRALLA